MLGLLSRPVLFKAVFSSKTMHCQINPFITIEQLIDTLRPHLSTQFGINQNEFELVVADQYELGIPPENALRLEPSNDKLCLRWGENLEGLTFYVRRRNYVYPQVDTYFRDISNRATSSNIKDSTFLGDCPICLETTTLMKRYKCVHGVCSSCYDRCQESSITICSLCRTP